MNTPPYTFTIKNTCTTFISYDVIFLVDKESTLGTQYVDVVLDRNVIKTLDQYESREIENQTGYILQSGNFSQADEITYNLRMWLDEEVTVDEPVFNTSLKGKIRIEAKITNYSPIDQGFNKLADAMLVNEYQSSSVEVAKQQIESKQAPDFSETAPIIVWTENHASTTSENTTTMPHPNLVGTGGIAAKLTQENVLLSIGTSYTFDSETGQYTLTSISNLDPTTLNYNGDTKYYFCIAGFNTSSDDVITTYQNTSCSTMYQIVAASSSDGTSTGAGGTEFANRSYQMTTYEYTQSEQESDQSDKGLYVGTDDYGATYYYRGNVNNNYVYFAGYYWRIIRQNGDGSIRLLYAGTSANATGTDLRIGTTPFNSERNSPAYVGYMYGNTINESYEKNIANEMDGNIKTELDNWYKSNIEDKGFSEYVADSGFCNDRSLNEGDGVSLENNTNYGFATRYQSHTPTLVCPQQNDLFTVTNAKGNQALEYPIGLITADELMFSGLADGYLNRLSYTYSSNIYWAMSPRYFFAIYTAARIAVAHPSGYIYFYNANYSYSVRPVINLASDVEISGGIGTSNDPYVVKVV